MAAKIAIITARGGSKRIPKKNIKDFCGKPIIAYSIEAALNSELFDEVMVSTDSQEIADISRKFGARIPFMRSVANSNDFAGTDDVLLEVLSEYQNMGYNFDIMCCIYPTAPFVTPKKLIKGYQMLTENHAMKVLPVVAFSYPPQRALIKDENNEKLKYIYPDKYMSRSQDLEKWYHDVGQFYFFDVEAFVQSRGKIYSDIIPLELPETEVQDIDNEGDWLIAEMKYRLMCEKYK